MCTTRGGRTGRSNSTVVGHKVTYLRCFSGLGMHYSIVYMVDCCVNISNYPDTSCILFGLIETNESEEDRRMEDSIWYTSHTPYPYLFDYVGVVAVN